MEKNPAECKNSIRVHGIYICQIEQIPCARARECALDKVERMSNAMKELIHSDWDLGKEYRYD